MGGFSTVGIDYDRIASTADDLRKALCLLHPVVKLNWAVKRYGAVIDEAGIQNANPSVIRDGDIYRMYHTRRESSTDYFKVVMRTSYDGKSWSSPTVVMTKDMVNAAGYDVTGVFQPCVLKKDSTYYLFFAGDQMQPWGVRRHQTFLATSSDGVNFSNIRAVIALAQSSIRGAAWHPYVFSFRGKYYMICIMTDYRLPRTNPMNMRLGLWESSDLIKWSFSDVISMEGVVGEWDGGRMFDHSIVNIDDAVLLMVYASESKAGNVDMRIGLAYSFDARNWFRSRMLLARVLDSEALYIADSSILYEGGKLKIWYEANDGVTDTTTNQPTVRMMYAEAVPSKCHIMELWINKTVPTTGLATDDVDTKFKNVNFCLISDQSGTAYIQAYNEATGDFIDAQSFSVSANALAVLTPSFSARRMKLRFVPSAQATASAWMVSA